MSPITDNYRRDGVRYAVFLNGTAAPWLEVISVEQTHGSDRLDHAVLEWNLGRNPLNAGQSIGHFGVGQNIDDLVLGEPFASTTGGVECEIRTSAGDSSVNVVHWGKLSLQEVDIGGFERLRMTSRTERCHFGTPLTFQRTVDPATGSPFWISGARELPLYLDEEVVFNPTLNGVIFGNKRTVSRLNYPIFVHPESARTSNAADYQDVDYYDPLNEDVRDETWEGNWDLASAVQYLCGECNPAQRYIQNPTAVNLRGVLPLTGALLKNHPIRAGLYLPEALDALLNPYGFSWYVQYQGVGLRRIVVFRLGWGSTVQVGFQRPGSKLQPSQQDAESLGLAYDESPVCNQIRVFGSKTMLEGTFELIPAWTEDQDGTDFELLCKDSEDWLTNVQYHRVGRDFVLNEAGDYKRSVPYDLTSLFQPAFGDGHPPVVARRRQFLPTLSREKDGIRSMGLQGGVVVEWLDPDEGEWRPIPTDAPEWSFRVLTGECGISFTGNEPPAALWEMGSQVKLRVTATIESDSRLTFVAPWSGNSASPQVREQVCDKSQSFHWRQLVESGTAKSIFAGKGLPARTADGREALEEFALAMQQAWDQVSLSGSIVLEGLDRTGFGLGNCVNKIRGREIYLRCNASSSQPRYPQIVGLRHHVQEQQLELILEAPRDPESYVGRLIKDKKNSWKR